jgi:hypothetical protein
MARAVTMSLSGVRIIWRNFSARETKYKKAGDERSFHVVIPEERVDDLVNDGWPIKKWEPGEDSDPVYHMKVVLKYSRNNNGPKAFAIMGDRKIFLTEETISTLDFANIIDVDMTIRQYEWDLGGGRCGIAAYLNDIYVVIQPDEFEEKYRDIPLIE